MIEVSARMLSGVSAFSKFLGAKGSGTTTNREQGDAIRSAEAFELCEYGRQASAEELNQLFP